jgi:flavoprotein
MAMNKVDINDILTNDPEIYNQKFFVLSYILPSDKNEIKHPLIKMRGAFKTYEDAEKRVDVLKRSDKYFNIYIATVGTWGSLLPEEQLLQSDEVDTVYREPELNEIFQKYKENREKAQEEHGLGMCNITKCCTEVCPEHIKITDNAIIPMKERVVDIKYDPARMFSGLLRREKRS